MVDLHGSSANTENLLRIRSGPTNRLKETVQRQIIVYLNILFGILFCFVAVIILAKTRTNGLVIVHLQLTFVTGIQIAALNTTPKGQIIAKDMYNHFFLEMSSVPNGMDNL